ncbi:alpha/beta hydrolase [Azoarcus sp. L1K30]|uniref:alpha/beta hydrolase n=1 Tax=Azoarcus sp. L1K30 TaxID=2820277 RepID=UPI001B8431DB|nr:alpha/beta hydrolase [Azoarcus sp. L1K30]MBR0565040.1 alpha/beta hydrolase [Azoarcus sp. L1K30]
MGFEYTVPAHLLPSEGTDFAREYDVSCRVPDFAGSLADWGRRAALARTLHPGLCDLRYGQSAAETLDLFLPPLRDGTPAPLLVFIHGGFWRRLHKDDFSWIATPYLTHGVAVAVVNYGLAPATTLEDITAQTRRSIAWLYRHAPEYGVDATRIVVSGHSAGGQLTCMALATDWPAIGADLPRDLLAAGIALSPVVDLKPLASVPALHADLDFNPARIRDQSPVRLRPASDAPLIGAAGGRESAEFRRQLALLANAWQGVWKGEVAMPAADHLTLCDAFADEGSALFSAALELIRSVGNGSRLQQMLSP